MILNLVSILILTNGLLLPADYQIKAIQYATIPQFPMRSLVVGAPEGEKLDIAMVIWLIQGNGRNILFDSGFHREVWKERFNIADFMPPDKAVELAGVKPGEITDIIISHAHWDHMGGIDLFPNATIWIQKQEFEYYLGRAWQQGGRHGGIDPDDLVELLRRNTAGKLRLVEGDDMEIIPGIRVFTGARHTYASQYILIETKPSYLLASDNCYLYHNLNNLRPVMTFAPEDSSANKTALKRMLSMVESPGRIIPGHDPLQFERFPTQGRVATIR